MKKKFIAIGLAALVLAGCSSEFSGNTEDDGIPSTMAVDVVQLPDGREVVCVAWKLGYAGGLQCDWDNAK